MKFESETGSPTPASPALFSHGDQDEQPEADNHRSAMPENANPKQYLHAPFALPSHNGHVTG